MKSNITRFNFRPQDLILQLPQNLSPELDLLTNSVFFESLGASKSIGLTGKTSNLASEDQICSTCRLSELHQSPICMVGRSKTHVGWRDKFIDTPVLTLYKLPLPVDRSRRVLLGQMAVLGGDILKTRPETAVSALAMTF